MISIKIRKIYRFFKIYGFGRTYIKSMEESILQAIAGENFKNSKILVKSDLVKLVNEIIF